MSIKQYANSSALIRYYFGEQFKFYRKQAKLSRAKMGAELGISHKTIQSWDCGQGPESKTA